MRDPIVKLCQRMIDAEMATEEEFKAIDKEVRASVKAQADAALAAPEPDMSLLKAYPC
jgi:pyruvate dehydrogenase E1 component alpha subunit